MKRRGRSVIDQTAAVVIGGSFGERAEPPAELNDRQRDIWRAIVASEPAEFFATAACRNLLADLCRHRETVEKLSAAVEDCDAGADDLSRYQTLLAMRAREIGSSVMLATKLRLTNQSRYLNRTAATAATNAVKGSKPWQDRAAA